MKTPLKLWMLPQPLKAAVYVPIGLFAVLVILSLFLYETSRDILEEVCIECPRRVCGRVSHEIQFFRFEWSATLAAWWVQAFKRGRG